MEVNCGTGPSAAGWRSSWSLDSFTVAAAVMSPEMLGAVLLYPKQS